MVYYFVGEDTYAARQAIDVIAQKKQATVRWLDRQEFLEKPLEQWLDQAAGGLFSVEILVVRDPSSMPKTLQESVANITRSIPVAD